MRHSLPLRPTGFYYRYPACPDYRLQGPGTGDRYPLQVKKLHELAQQALR